MVVTGTAMKVEVPMARPPCRLRGQSRRLDQHAVLKLDESPALSLRRPVPVLWFRTQMRTGSGAWLRCGFLPGWQPSFQHRLLCLDPGTLRPFGLHSVWQKPLRRTSSTPSASATRPAGLGEPTLGSRDLRQVGVMSRLSYRQQPVIVWWEAGPSVNQSDSTAPISLS